MLLQDNHGHYYTKLGSLIQVIIRLQTNVQRYHVALVDECPSGFEPLINESDELDPEDPWKWYEQQLKVGYAPSLSPFNQAEQPKYKLIQVFYPLGAISTPISPE